MYITGVFNFTQNKTNKYKHYNKTTVINSSIPSGREVLLSLFKYSMMSFVCKPTDTAAYKE